MMLRKLIAFAITSGLAKKAWDHYRTSGQLRRRSSDVIDVDPKPAGLRVGRGRRRVSSRTL